MLEITISILSSFIAASMFVLFLSKLRPSLKISEKIAFLNKEDTDYEIKVINNGLRNVINIKVEIDLMESRIVPDGTILNSKPIKIKKSERMTLSKFSKKDKEATYAYRIVILDDLNLLWNNESTQFIRIRIFSQDEMSNFGKVFTQDFRTKRNSLQEGQFRFGNSLEIS
jgi:hypothetical protein